MIRERERDLEHEIMSRQGVENKRVVTRKLINAIGEG